MEYVLIALVVFSAAAVTFLAVAQSGDPPSPGSPLPAFRLGGTDGASHSDETLRGRPAVIFFLPMDETPECLAVARAFAEAAPRIEAAGAKLLAIAVATPEAASRYALAHSLPYPILADADGRAARAFGSLVNLVAMRFAKKLTVLAGPDGRVKAVWRDNAGTDSVAQVLARLAPPAP